MYSIMTPKYKSHVYIVMAYYEDELYYNKGQCIGVAATAKAANGIIDKHMENYGGYRYVTSVWEVEE